MDTLNIKKADVAYCQLKSKERGVKVGDVRVIADEMIYCIAISRDWDAYPFSKPIVEWKSNPLNREELRELGVPWYCDDCGKQATYIHEGTLDELKKFLTTT